MPIPSRLSLLSLPVLLLAGPAAAIEVQRSIEVDAPPAEVWEAVSGFCSIEEWHPEVADCTLEEDDVTTYRTVETTDGRSFREQLMAQNEETRFYSTTLVESPWPFAGLVSEFQVAPGPDGSSIIVWQANISTITVDEDEAADDLGQLYEMGLEGIATMFDEA
jgi:hypothetical protein